MPQHALLLINLGTPDAPRTPEVRRYLREFLSDPRVIDIPGPLRFLLVNCIIAPFRSPKSAEAYAQVWTDLGSPLLVHGRHLASAVAAELGDDWHVDLGMRYGRPSLADAYRRCRESGAEQVVVLPLYPQYALATTGSTLEELDRIVARDGGGPELVHVPPYYDRPEFVDAAVEVARDPLAGFDPDHVLMSFHGLPERQVTACDPSGSHCLVEADCCARITAVNTGCYRAHCYATGRAIARALQLDDGMWEVAFQSRLGRTPWIRPYTDQRVRELAADGKRRLAVLTPSFTADCLETLEEIGMRARDEFVAQGGEELLTVPCVNSHPAWVRGVVTLALAARGSQNDRGAGSGSAPA